MLSAVLIVVSLLASPIGAAPIKVEIRPTESGFALYRGDKPYVIRGAGADNVDDLESLARAGANSTRTWSADAELLDRAAELGLTVALCLNVERERHGFDYNDREAVARQLEAMRQKVLQFRDHPALLVWIIGNELNHDYRNRRVYDAVNDISKMIHELDPHHPTTTATAGMDRRLARVLKNRAPDLDFISIQLYGSAIQLPTIVRDARIKRPLMITEWGTTGHWEVPLTRWGAPIEPTSREKAEHYRLVHDYGLTPLGGQLIGNYAFLWGQKQERTPTWYGVFTPDGAPTAAADTMEFLWRGVWPDDRAPELTRLRLDGKTAADDVSLREGAALEADVEFTSERPPARLQWLVMRESEATEQGGDREDVPEALDGLVAPHSSNATSIALTAPEPGNYRLFVYAYSEGGRAAHANIPFRVLDEK